MQPARVVAHWCVPVYALLASEGVVGEGETFLERHVLGGHSPEPADFSRLLLGCLVLQRWEEVAGHLQEAISLAAKPNARMDVYVTSLDEILRDRQQPPHVLQHGLEHGLAVTGCGPGLVRVRVAHHVGRVSVQLDVRSRIVCSCRNIIRSSRSTCDT